jgi:FecR protein
VPALPSKGGKNQVTGLKAEFRNMNCNVSGFSYSICGGNCRTGVCIMLRNSLIVCSVMVASLVGVGSAATAERIGKVAAVVGAPSASGPGGSRTLKAGSDVFEDDRVVVKTGNAQIVLDDNTRLVVGPGSTLLLDQYVVKGKGTASRVAVKALRGTYRFITGRSAKSAYKITTAQATIGIRGTGFDFWVKKKTGAAVINGKVNLRGQNGGSTDVGSGCNVGEATRTNAKPVTGRAKLALIKENLPFLLDQSSLRARFRLNIQVCNLASSESIRGSGPELPPEQPTQPRPNPNPNPDGNGTGTDN